MPELLTPEYKERLVQATEAVYGRYFYAAFPEHPKAYAEDGQAKANEWFEGLLDNDFTELLQTGHSDTVGDEISPYTQELLDISYPFFEADVLVARAASALDAWRYASVDARTAVLLESMDRIKQRFFDIALATMHTSGQSYMMSFQASGPHAMDRAMEAVAIGHREMNNFPATAHWEKPMGKFNIKVNKAWKPISRGISLVVGCSTFPVWNSVPGIYASLVTGNPVIVKPHPGGILPIAVVVAELQKSLQNHGFDPLTVQLAADTNSRPLTKELAEHKLVSLIDYTGGPSFGNYLEGLKNKVVFTEKAGVNSVIIDSTDNLEAVMSNLAFALCLYSGQMCTAPQNILIPATGVREGDRTVPYEEVVEKLRTAVLNLVNNPKIGPGTLGAIQNPNTSQRVLDIQSEAEKVILEPVSVQNPDFPNARLSSPLIIEHSAKEFKEYSEELFGPIAIVVKTANTDESIAIASRLATEKGAISSGAYTTDEGTKQKIMHAMEAAFTPVAFNFTGMIWMNQNAAFSDFHVTGGNPAGNATFTDSAYISRRFAWVGHKDFVA